MAYFDICALKRPFDDQTQPRLRLEAEAALELLGAPADRISFVHAAAHDLENAQNPLRWPAARVATLLDSVPRSVPKADELTQRVQELIALGFRNFDALHVASAEAARADVFATTDDRLLALGTRLSAEVRVRVIDVVSLAREVFG